ncbi:MAG: flagellar type III secretion system pore protein FliP [Rhodobacteraceae bacterium]|nr:flagellar type III secretion system pore protein FliP [Paracoccaceae bacterium]
MAAALVPVLVLVPAPPALAQGLPLVPGDGSLAGQAVFLFAALGVLSLAPGIAIMVTCFPFILTVLSILRQAIGLQQAPPNMLLVSLSLFLTWYVMEPVLTEAWTAGVVPFAAGEIAPDEAFARAAAPFRTFMEGRADPEVIAELAAARGLPGTVPQPGEPPLSLIVPAFLLSEVARAFQIGFMLFLPFLVIDLVVSAVLMAMGMMMVPPAIVSLPFKLAFFVLADGWTLVASALVRGYG